MLLAARVKGPSRHKEAAMARVIVCEDGVVIHGANDDELVANALKHIEEAHPDLVGKLSRDDLLGMATEA